MEGTQLSLEDLLKFIEERSAMLSAEQTLHGTLWRIWYEENGKKYGMEILSDREMMRTARPPVRSWQIQQIVTRLKANRGDDDFDEIQFGR